MQQVFPPKLTSGDEIRIIAPSRTFGIINQNLREVATTRLTGLGFKLSFGKHIEEKDDFASSSITSRIEDLHAAFSDKNIKAILTVIGGFNSNQLLSYIDWDLIKNNPKILCGYSDITALNNSIFAKTGLVTYSGPHFSTFGQEQYFDYSLDYFKKCLMSQSPIDVLPSETWSDDPWYKDQKNRHPIVSSGHWILSPGSAIGTLLGANLCTFNLLHGTSFMPDLSGSVLFIEDDSDTNPDLFDRDLQSIIHQPRFDQVQGLVIGRFQNASNMTKELLSQIIASKKELSRLPILANVEFGHTDPKITFPVGGTVSLEVSNSKSKLSILKH